jgi:HK97 family phage portal protein
MSWWQTLTGAFGVGRLANLDKGQQHSGNLSRSTEANIVVSDERAMALPSVFACTRLITQSGATLPLALYTKTDTGDRLPLPDNDPLTRLLRIRPNQYMNALEWRQAMFCQRVLWGNAYSRIDRRGDGEVSSLLPLKPEHVTVHREAEGIRFEYASDAGSETYWNRVGQPHEMFHWRGFSPDGVIGLSPLSYSRQSMGIAVAADRHASRAFTGRPNGVLSTDKILQDDHRKQLRDLYGKITDSADGQWWLLEAGFKYQEIGMPPDDLQMLQSRQWSVSEICNFYGVPAVMVNGGANASANWPAAYEKHILAFNTFTLKP